MTVEAALRVLGWTDERDRAFGPLCAAGLAPARVSLEHNHVFRVMTADGERLAESAGRMKHRARSRQALPVVGDWVAVRAAAAEGARLQICEVLPRETWFSRRAAGRETEEQVVAANVNTVLLTFGLDQPLKPSGIERYLLVARASGAAAVVVLNKAELAGADVDALVAEAREAAGEAPVLAVSARLGTGLEAIESRLREGHTMALLGPSGAGKSSIVNRLIGVETLRTGDVRPWDARGRHTSVHRQLVVRPQGGLIIDTPGMRELQLWESEPVAGTFADIAELGAGCRFRDCRHEGEPDCAVRAAIDAGTLEARRWESYLKLRTEQEASRSQREERARIDARREGRVSPRSPARRREREGQ
jgi:ribosome biogenesis GTPase